MSGGGGGASAAVFLSSIDERQLERSANTGISADPCFVVPFEIRMHFMHPARLP